MERKPMRAGRVAGKVALVTGAASGIGRATALALAREGARVVASDLAAPDVTGIVEAGGEAIGVAHDVRDEGAWASVLATATERFGGLDVLVNNAGIGGTGPLLDTTLEAWRRVMSVNIDGVFLGTRGAVAAMQAHPREQAGSIVNVSSILGLVGGISVAAYSASKGAVRLFTKAAALEGAAQGRPVRVNSVHPGYIRTPLVAARLSARAGAEGRTVDVLAAELAARHPLGRLGEAEDVAHAIVYLASEESAFVTGSELVVDGGFTAQ